jgi:peptidoglycan/xylan/chitin deacetylase (PgdA/CDA1 family)
MLNRAGAAGVAVGSHTRHHASLIGLEGGALNDEIAGSLRDLERSQPGAIPLLSYPYGHCDRAAREKAIAAGYSAAYTTTAGRNAAGTDRWCLRRISVQSRNGVPSFLWKVMTGEPLPERWERRLVAREAAAHRRREGRK